MNMVTLGESMQCSFGASPSSLVVLPGMVMSTKPAATILDFKPIVNIPPFGVCNTISNPQVAAATAAKLGVFTPMPCIPVTVAPWAPGSAMCNIMGIPILNNTSKLMCTWGGVIQFVSPGEVTCNVP